MRLPILFLFPFPTSQLCSTNHKQLTSFSKTCILSPTTLPISSSQTAQTNIPSCFNLSFPGTEPRLSLNAEPLDDSLSPFHIVNSGYRCVSSVTIISIASSPGDISSDDIRSSPRPSTPRSPAPSGWIYSCTCSVWNPAWRAVGDVMGGRLVDSTTGGSVR